MDTLETVRQAVDTVLRQNPVEEHRRNGVVHLYGVSALCVQLALRRGLDPQLCAVAGMLHDISTYTTGDPTDHAHLSAIDAQRIMATAQGFTESEIALVCDAISHHSDKGGTHGEMAELLKDADVLQHYLYNPALTDMSKNNASLDRLRRILGEFTLNKRDANANVPSGDK